MNIEQLKAKANGIDRINIQNISNRGTYYDPETGDRFRLNDLQIEILRHKYRDIEIANSRVTSSASKEEYVELMKYRRESARKYKLVRDRKEKVLKTAKALKKAFKGKTVRIAGVVIVAELTFLGTFFVSSRDVVEAPTIEITEYHNVADSLDLNEFDQVTTTEVTTEVPVAEEEPTTEFVTLIEAQPEVIETVDPIQQRKEAIIRNYCAVYGLNYDIVYNKLVELTDNFTSEDFLQGIIPGVTCKGQAIQTESEELLLLTAIRHFSQLPSDFNLSADRKNNPVPYEDDMSYEECIAYYGNIIGEGDPYVRDLAYGIYIAETGGDSDLLVGSNNYGGLTRESGGFASFSNKQEGAIEFLCTVKYGYMAKGMDTPARMQEVYAPSYENDGAWWISTVSSVMNTAENVLAPFDEEERNLNR